MAVFEPSSRTWRLRGEAALSCQPTSAEPVKVITATSGCSFQVGTITSGRPVTMFSQPARQSGLGHRLGEQARGQRRALRRLEYDRAARSQSRRDLVQHQVEREVERGDRRHHAVRLRDGETQRRDPGAISSNCTVSDGQPPGLLRRDPQGVDGAAHLDPGRGDGLSRLGAQQLGEGVRPLRDQSAGREQEVGALGRRPAGEHGGLGGRHRLSRLVGAGHRDGAHQGLVERVVNLEGVDPGDPVAVDEELLVTHEVLLSEMAGTEIGSGPGRPR